MIYLLLADGFEETEMIAPLDILRRAGVSVKTVGISGKTVCGAHGVPVTADLLPDEVDPSAAEGVILPGGMPGTTNLQADAWVGTLLQKCAAQKKLLAAICAAPMILGEMGLLKGKSATCFPGFEENLHGAIVKTDPVVQDKNIITSRGAGTALLFGAAIADALCGEGTGARILAQMQAPDYV